MKKNYIKPELQIYQCKRVDLLVSSTKWNDVGNFGPGDKDDDDREGDDNWDEDWSWNVIKLEN